MTTDWFTAGDARTLILGLMGSFAAFLIARAYGWTLRGIRSFRQSLSTASIRRGISIVRCVKDDSRLELLKLSIGQLRFVVQTFTIIVYSLTLLDYMTGQDIVQALVLMIGFTSIVFLFVFADAQLSRMVVVAVKIRGGAWSTPAKRTLQKKQWRTVGIFPR